MEKGRVTYCHISRPYTARRINTNKKFARVHTTMLEDTSTLFSNSNPIQAQGKCKTIPFSRTKHPLLLMYSVGNKSLVQLWWSEPELHNPPVKIIVPSRFIRHADPSRLYKKISLPCGIGTICKELNTNHYMLPKHSEWKQQ